MKRVLFPLIALLLCLSEARAEIYSWTDENGKTHYSNTPKNSKAKSASLPELKRENLDEKIKKIKQSTPLSCQNHGGVNCEAGEDQDHSVICNDGFLNSRERFSTSCKLATIGATAFYFTYNSGNDLVDLPLKTIGRPKFEKPGELTVVVRNTSPTAATGVSLKIVPTFSLAYEATGPSKIPAYSATEYTLPASEISDLLVLRNISYKISCSNCKSIRKALPR